MKNLIFTIFIAITISMIVGCDEKMRTEKDWSKESKSLTVFNTMVMGGCTSKGKSRKYCSCITVGMFDVLGRKKLENFSKSLFFNKKPTKEMIKAKDYVKKECEEDYGE